MNPVDLDAWHMARALQLAELGRGAVEPNPLVGCVITKGAEVIGEGFHRRFGGPHAEVEALAIAGRRAAGATMYVTLEPCCHWGKTPPCTDAIIAAGVARVVVALSDPFPQVDGGGLRALQAAGIEVALDVGRAEADRQNAPYLKLLLKKRPWVIAKWAMTLDGRLATRTGSSQWISNAASRGIVHALRGRVDAIIVGRSTVDADDPQLTARPTGARVATRIVFDRQARISLDSQLVRTARQVPVLIVTQSDLHADRVQALVDSGCEVFNVSGDDLLQPLLDELGRRRMTNVLVEGGSGVMGLFFDAREVDEVHVFIAPKLIGGAEALGPIGGAGLAEMVEAVQIDTPQIQTLDGDIYLTGRTRRS